MKAIVAIPFFLSLAAGAQAPRAGNPVISGWYADPEAHVFAGQYWIYPTYSAPYNQQVLMDAFSSPDLITWTKHERIIDTASVKWAKRAMWAPSVIEKDGWYYLFFGANDIQNDEQRGGIGVARSRSPGGPFTDYLGKPLIDAFHNGAQPIDQMVFRDASGSYYIVYGGWKHCNIARLNDDFTGFIPFPDGTTYKEITPSGYVEGAFMLVKDNKYYFMWSEGGWTGPDYAVAYAVGTSPFGPFERVGKILQQDPSVATGAGHHSVFQSPTSSRWYIAYHRRPLGETDRNHRVVSIDELHFDANGMIQPVKITREGVARDPLAAGQVDPQRADAYFKEAAAICQRDGGRLWGVSLCGPIVIADARTGTIATNQPAPAAERPRTFGFANAPVEWGGMRWVSLVWNFIESLPDANTRGELMLHELFHRIQPQLGLLAPGNALQTAHLDTFEGRVWLRLEWQALVRALRDTGDARTRAVRDALAFRATRRSQFRDAAESERNEEIREGIAQYTGIVATAASRSEAIARTIAHVTGAEGHETFLQQSYTTGTAYAVLLDDASPDWRRRVRSDSDLGQMLMVALNITPTADVAQASARYGGAEIRAAEQSRAEQRKIVVRELQSRFVEGPVLLIPSGGGATFNAVGATPIPGAGTVYVLPYNAKGAWGTLDARKGVLIGDDGTRRVPGPVRIDGATLSGDGWTLIVATGWAVRPGSRAGDYQVVREP